MEAIPVKGSRGMGEWMGIGRVRSTDIITVIVHHAIKLWRVHKSILYSYTSAFQQGVFLYKNTPMNPTRFDSMTNNGYDIDGPPLLSTLLLLSSLRFTVRCYTTVSLYTTIPFYGKRFYTTFYGMYTVHLYEVC